MIRQTLKDVRPELTRIAGATGFLMSDPRFIARLNAATKELMDEGDWPGVVDRYKFAVYGGIITLPGDLERIMGIAANGTPLEMRSPWYEFAQDGPGPQESQSWIDVVLDRGEVSTFQNIPTDGQPYALYVSGEVDERTAGIRPKIIIRGYDINGRWVRSMIGGVMEDGVEVEINGDTAPQATACHVVFKSIDSVTKPKTKGYVTLTATNGSASLALATYASRETNPTYRQYFIPHLAGTTVHKILVRARKRFVQVANENDVLIISNISALESMMMALQKRHSSVKDYLTYKAVAVGIMRRESEAYLGKTIQPAMTFAQGFGLGSIPHVQ